MELQDQARERGELVAHGVPAETAGVLVGLVGAFAGVQAVSRSRSGHQDLPRRVAGPLRHVLPSVVIPPVLASVDLSETRGAWVQEQLSAAGTAPGPGSRPRACHLTPPGTAPPAPAPVPVRAPAPAPAITPAPAPAPVPVLVLVAGVPGSRCACSQLPPSRK